MARYRHLLFDLDRTLWDFDGNAEAAFKELYGHFELSKVCSDYNLFHNTYKAINESLWEQYRNGTVSKEYLHTKRFSLSLEYFHPSPSNIGKLSATMADYYLDACSRQTGLMPNCIEALEYLTLKQDYSLSIISNGFREAQIPKMASSGLTPYFAHVFLSEEIGCQKPNARFFKSVLEGLGANSDECLVIGDDLQVDILGAQQMGIDQVFYNPKQSSTKGISPTYTISNLGQLKDIL